MAPTLLPLALLACQPGVDADIVIDAALSEAIPTVLTLSWTTEAAVEQATLHIETAEGEAWTVDASAGEAVAWGLPPDTDFDAWLEFSLDDGVLESDVASFTTGAAPVDLPVLEVEGDPARALDGALLLTTSLASPGAAVLLDGEGRYRWWYALTETLPVGRARLSVDGAHVLVMPVNVGVSDNDPLLRVSLDGTRVEEVAPGGQHHDFYEHDDGTLAFLVSDRRDVDGVSVAGDRLVEVAPDGTEREVWNVWDHLDYSETGGYLPGGEWTHANALDYDATEGAYFVSFLGLKAIFRIDRATGAIDWRLGTGDSDFVDERGDTTILDNSHQFELGEGTLLAFENGPSEEQSSRAVLLAFDEQTEVVEELWRYEPSPSLYTYSLGDVATLGSGDVLVDFSVAGVVVQLDGDEPVWQLSAQLGGAFGYMELLTGVAGR